MRTATTPLESSRTRSIESAEHRWLNQSGLPADQRASAHARNPEPGHSQTPIEIAVRQVIPHAGNVAPGDVRLRIAAHAVAMSSSRR